MTLRTPVALALSLLTVAVGGAQSQLTPEQVRADLELYRAALEQLHAGLETYATRGELQDAFGRLSAEPLPGTPLELYRRLAPMAAVIRDGHTELLLSDAIVAERNGWPLLPFEMHVLDGRVWIAADYRGVEPSLAGRLVLAIDGRPIDTVLAALLAAQPRDGRSASGPSWRLSRNGRFAIALATLFGPRAEYRLRLQGQAGPADVTVAGIALDTLRQRIPRPPAAEPVTWSFDAKTGAAVLTVRSFGSQIGGDLRRAFSEFRQRRTQGLVIDVRGNGGGYDNLGRVLFAHLADRPFDYYKGLFVRTTSPQHPGLAGAAAWNASRIERDPDGRIRLTGHANLGTQQPEEATFGGRVFVLVDGGSFSTTAEFLARAHASGRVTLVGEESGGGYCGNTSGGSHEVRLPNSGLRLVVPLVRYEMAVPCDRSGRAVPPHVPMPRTIEDRLAGRDRAMEYALGQLSGSVR